MYRKIDDVRASWAYEAEATQKVFNALTDESLSQAVADGHRTIARVVWHMVRCVPGMANETGLKVPTPEPNSGLPSDAATVQSGWGMVAAALDAQIADKWDDATLEIEDSLYGETWKRGKTLTALMMHNAHHRGQLTVLMRQAGLKVPGVYGPSNEEWTSFGIPDPEPDV